jgi:hypothetical protein
MVRGPRKPLIRKPTEVSLEGFSSHFDVVGCIAFVAMALERADLVAADVLPYQRRLLEDLNDPLDEEALAGMLAYWQFDISKLSKRGRDWNRDLPAKPKIDVEIEITSKCNLKAEWYPRAQDGDEWRHWSDCSGSDFLHFRRSENRVSGYGGRPSNELMFLHSAETVLNSLKYGHHGTTWQLNHVLLLACEQAVIHLKKRLAYHFDVRMLTDVFVEWEKPTAGGSSRWEPPRRIFKWEIADPAERLRAKELRELEEMESQLGFSETDLATAMATVTENGIIARNPPVPHTLPERLAKELKRMGLLTATKGNVGRALYLVNEFREPAKPSGIVVPFRKPEA